MMNYKDIIFFFFDNVFLLGVSTVLMKIDLSLYEQSGERIIGFTETTYVDN